MGFACGERQSGAPYSIEIGGVNWVVYVVTDSRELTMEIGGVGWVVYVVRDSRELTIVWR